jgi:hypothetical protein
LASDTYTYRADTAREPEFPRSGVAQDGGSASFRPIPAHERKAITSIIEAKLRLKLAQAQVREDVKTVADRLGMKAGELNRIMKLATQERERGNVLAHERALIAVAEQLAG